jgi:branched-chain amino acid transport system substrate-binding protein
LKRDFEEVRIPVIPASYHEGLIVDANYTFMPVATYSENAVGLAEYITENHKGDDIPQVAFFIHPSAFGRAPLEDTQKAIAEGLKIDIVEVVEHGTDLDNTAMLQRLVSKGVQYVICQTVQTPVATMLTDAQRLGVTAGSFGEKGKLTFLGAHYTGGSDLIALAGDATEGYIWADSYNLTSENNEGAKKQLELAERYGRDDKAANSHNYGAGILAAQIATEAIKETKKAGLEINRENIYKTMQTLNFEAFSAVGPVTYSETERIGVDVQNIYVAEGGIFKKVKSMESQFMRKVRAGR